MVKPQLPITMLVTPSATDGVANGSQMSWASKCVCRSMMPGASASPCASRRWAAPPQPSPTAAMRPSLTARLPCRAGAPVPSISNALSMTRSCILPPFVRV